MDNELHQRIEGLEEVCRRTLEAIHGLRDDFEEFRKEQREESRKTQALLRQFGARVGGVEGRIVAVEERLQAVEDSIFRDD